MGKHNDNNLNPQRLLSRLARLRTFESLKERDFRLLWLGQLFSSMGQWMDQVTRGWLIYQITGSALQLGLATAIRGLPLLLFGIVAGAVADRSDRKTQLIIAQATNALLNAILATLVLTRQIEPWHIYVTGFLAGSVQAFQQPARQTLINDLVGNRRLMNALSLNSAAVNGSRMIGPAIAGLLIAWTGAEGSYYAQALLYVFATVWTFQMQVPKRSKEETDRPRESFITSMKVGMAYVGQNRNIRALMLLALAPLTLGMPYTSLMPIFAQDVLHGGAELQGLLLTFGGIGSFIGAVVLASMRRQSGYAWTVVIGAAAFGLALMGFAFSVWVPVSLAFAAIVGVFSLTYRTQNQTLLQVLSPRHIRGRVMSIYMLDRGLVPFATLLMAALAAMLGAPKALFIMSGASLVVIALTVLLHRGFIRLKVPLEDEAVDELHG